MNLQEILDAVFPYEDAEVKGLTAEVASIDGNEATVEWLISPPDELRGPVVGRIHYIYDEQKDVLTTDRFLVHAQKRKGVLTRFAAHSTPIIVKLVGRYEIPTLSEPVIKVLTAGGWDNDGELWTISQ